MCEQYVCIYMSTVAPVAYQVVLEPGIGGFFVSSNPPSANSYKFVGTFSCSQIDLRKAREQQLATALDEKWTSSGIAEPYARQKVGGKNRGEKRGDACDHGLSRSWKVDVCGKKEKNKMCSTTLLV